MFNQRGEVSVIVIVVFFLMFALVTREQAKEKDASKPAIVNSIGGE